MKNWKLLLSGIVAGTLLGAVTQADELDSNEARKLWSKSFECIGTDLTDGLPSFVQYDYQALGPLTVGNLEEYQGAVQVERQSIGWMKQWFGGHIQPPLVVEAFAAKRRVDHWIDGYAVKVSSPSGEAWMIWGGNHEVGLTPRAIVDLSNHSELECAP
jgi:hypothetical protein